MKLRHEQEPALDALTQVEIALDGKPLRCEARIVFVGPDLEDDPRHDVYRVGLSFVSPPRAAQRRLKRYIERLFGPV